MVKILGIILIFFLVMNVILIKKRKIEFKYSMIFIFSYIMFMILLCCTGLDKYFTYCAGVLYVPAYVFIVAVIIIFLIILYLMAVISDIEGKLTKLIQQNAILNNKINERLKK